MTWLALPLFPLAAYFLAGRHIRKQREADAEKYGLLFGNDGKLRRQFLDNPEHWDSF